MAHLDPRLINEVARAAHRGSREARGRARPDRSALDAGRIGPLGTRTVHRPKVGNERSKALQLVHPLLPSPGGLEGPVQGVEGTSCTEILLAALVTRVKDLVDPKDSAPVITDVPSGIAGLSTLPGRRIWNPTQAVRGHRLTCPNPAGTPRAAGVRRQERRGGPQTRPVAHSRADQE